MKRAMSYQRFIIASIRNKPWEPNNLLFCLYCRYLSGQFLMAGAEKGVDRGISRDGGRPIVVPAQSAVFLRGSGPNNNGNCQGRTFHVPYTR